MTFLVQHWLGLMGMPRRVANYPFLPHLATTLNDISSIGSFVLGASTFVFLYNVYKTWKTGERVTADDPWGFANSLEWATSCPPPRHNFTSIPRIRSERPAFDLHYPQIRSGPGPAPGTSSSSRSELGRESRGLPVPGLRRLLRRRRHRLLALLARSDGHDRAGRSRWAWRS